MIYKCFKTKLNFYIYDTYSNNFFKVDKNIFIKFKENNDSDFIKKINILNNSRLFNGVNKIYEGHSLDMINDVLTSKVEKLTLFVSDCCNLQCTYCYYSDCYQHSKNLENNLMDFDTAKKAIDFYFNHSLKITKEQAIGFYGGEPLLNFEVIEKSVNYIKEKYKEKLNNLIFTISTNLICVDEYIIRFFINNNFHIAVSLDGPKYLHDRYRRDKSGKGSFDKVYANLMKFKEYDMEYFKNNIMFNVVLPPPIKFIEVYEFFKSDINIKVNDFSSISILSLIGNPNFEKYFKMNVLEGVDSEKDLFEIYKNETVKYDLCNDNFLSYLYHENFWNIHNRNMINLNFNIQEKNSCIPGSKRLMIDYKGDFYPCERGGFIKIGDIDSDFDINKCHQIRIDFSNIRNEICLDCWAIRFCKNCFLTATNNENEMNKDLLTEYCERIKKSTYEIIIRYLEIMELNKNSFNAFRRNINWQRYMPL